MTGAIDSRQVHQPRQAGGFDELFRASMGAGFGFCLGLAWQFQQGWLLAFVAGWGSGLLMTIPIGLPWAALRRIQQRRAARRGEHLRGAAWVGPAVFVSALLVARFVLTPEVFERVRALLS